MFDGSVTEGEQIRADTAPETGFMLGVNYWPRRKAMRWWTAFDREEVREEFAHPLSLTTHGLTIPALADSQGRYWRDMLERCLTRPLHIGRKGPLHFQP